MSGVVIFLGFRFGVFIFYIIGCLISAILSFYLVSSDEQSYVVECWLRILFWPIYVIGWFFKLVTNRQR